MRGQTPRWAFACECAQGRNSLRQSKGSTREAARRITHELCNRPLKRRKRPRRGVGHGKPSLHQRAALPVFSQNGLEHTARSSATRSAGPAHRNSPGVQLAAPRRYRASGPPHRRFRPLRLAGRSGPLRRHSQDGQDPRAKLTCSRGKITTPCRPWRESRQAHIERRTSRLLPLEFMIAESWPPRA